MKPARRRASRGPLSFLLLDGRSTEALHQQLFEALRQAIVRGRLTPGMRLPSSRALAEQLNIGRNTAVHALQLLFDEGYVVGRQGSGTYVAEAVPEVMLRARRGEGESRGGRAGAGPGPGMASPGLSQRGSAIASARNPLLVGAALLAAGRPFRLGTPALDSFPAELWGRLLQRRWQRSSAALVRHPSPLGYEPLRQAIAEYLIESRGVRCSADQVLIVNGSQQAFRIVLDLLIDPGDSVWTEDPGYLPARAAVLAAGGTPVPVPVDADGIVVSAGEAREPRARLAIITPQSQFPLVVTMSDERRRALMAWARRVGAWVLEDDYDSEFRYVGRSLPSLQGLDEDGRVIYVGTFSKVLGPALRLGYLVVPERLGAAFAAARAMMDVGSPLLEQSVLADFLAEGHFTRHVRRMRKLYEERQAALLAAARSELDSRLDLRPASSGMHLVGWLAEAASDEAVSARAAEAGLLVRPISMFRQEPGPPGLLLGYSAFTPQQIREGLRTLTGVL